MISVREVQSNEKKLINEIVSIHLNTFELLVWDEVSEGAVHVAKETQNGCWADIRI